MYFGNSSKTELDDLIRQYGQQAKTLLEETNADHVLYAIQYYGVFNKVTRFYLQPMSDDEFIKNFSQFKKKLIFAVHNPNLADKNVA